MMINLYETFSTATGEIIKRKTRVKFPGARTPEEITAQLEARYAELEREAQNPKRLYPCKTCRWAQRGSSQPWCYEPLSRGFEERVSAVDGWIFGNQLCGQEKALWEPRLSRIERIINWLVARREA